MSPLHTSTFVLPKILTITSVTVLLVVAILYILFQARLLIGGPQITLTSNLSTVQSERQITVQGHAENITFIYLNGRQIVTDEQGAFTETIVLENGYTIISITAQDRYGRETKIEKTFVYKGESKVKSL